MIEVDDTKSTQKQEDHQESEETVDDAMQHEQTYEDEEPKIQCSSPEEKANSSLECSVEVAEEATEESFIVKTKTSENSDAKEKHNGSDADASNEDVSDAIRLEQPGVESNMSEQV